MPVIDWHLFYNELVPDTMEVFLRAAKEASDFKKSAGAFYRYMFEFGGDPEFGHNALGRLLRSKHLDFAVVTASYFAGDKAMSGRLRACGPCRWHFRQTIANAIANEISEHYDSISDKPLGITMLDLHAG
jgi:hypothetical protein